MEKQNVTLSISKELLKRAKIIAIENDTSLSGLLTDALAKIVEESDLYSQAQARHVAFLREGTDLQSTYNWSREELHER